MATRLEDRKLAQSAIAKHTPSQPCEVRLARGGAGGAIPIARANSLRVMHDHPLLECLFRLKLSVKTPVQDALVLSIREAWATTA